MLTVSVTLGCYIGASNSYQPLVRYFVSLTFLLAATLLFTYRQDRSQSMPLFNMLSTLNVWPRSLYLKMRFTMGKTSLILEPSLRYFNLLHYIASYCFKIMNLTNVRNVSSLELFIHLCAAKTAVKWSQFNSEGPGFTNKSEGWLYDKPFAVFLPSFSQMVVKFPWCNPQLLFAHRFPLIIIIFVFFSKLLHFYCFLTKHFKLQTRSCNKETYQNNHNWRRHETTPEYSVQRRFMS